MPLKNEVSGGPGRHICTSTAKCVLSATKPWFIVPLHFGQGIVEASTALSRLQVESSALY